MREKIEPTVLRTNQLAPDILDRLSNEGIVSIPFLSRYLLNAFEQMCELLDYEAAPTEMGKRAVHQEIEIAPISFSSVIGGLARQIEKSIRQIATEPDKQWFEQSLAFDKVEAIRYCSGSSGIGVHKDYDCNIAGFVVVTGQGKLHRCVDEFGSEPVLVDTTPGNLVLMVGKGFRPFGKTSPYDPRPYHRVTDIESKRVIVRFSQKISA